MSEGPVRTCPGCGQALRFPGNIGGMLMACPVCGHRFASPFTLATAPPPLASNATFPPSSQSAPPSKSLTPSTLAARVAALYASKAR
ncbi:hypothetical protein [Solidesulfovibrio alcoholivorans]|uniref:hypothetical protein n=1 Tax=Solidesulfovibrio alcoholivorans TaxID=81406 RepID=UPI000497E7A3|nr:hypothetical protein [Solidesulfovibrio alcoholivorans]